MTGWPATRAGCPLTPRELEVVQLTAQGLSAKTIATRTGVRATSVRSTLACARARVGASTTVRLLLTAAEAGWLDPVCTTYIDGRVTPGQRLYLDGFDQLLTARGDDEVIAARHRTDHHLISMCMEAGIPVPRGGRRSSVRRELPGAVLPNLERPS